VSAEIPDFDLLRAINNGMLPRHYLIDNPARRWQAYIGDYLQEEIRAEALTRNLKVFSRFLEVAALTNGEMLNYNNIASDCGVSAVTIKEYFHILSETMIGYTVPAYTRVVKRRLIQTPKFYFFDVSIVNYLTKRRNMLPGSADFGHAFEHFIMQELIAFIGYYRNELTLSYWRTTTGYEVDAILGDAQTAIEIKSCTEVQLRHLHGLKALHEEYPQARLIIVSMDALPRMMNGVEVLPAVQFLQKLWKGEIISFFETNV
jgi:predicted AAA+ superfamily ATPase